MYTYLYVRQYVLHSVNICFVLVPIFGITSHFAYSIFFTFNCCKYDLPIIGIDYYPCNIRGLLIVLGL